jgi:hypothetical protein
MKRSSYTVMFASSDVVFIADDDIGMSVTNDAENVCKDVNRAFPGKRIVYRDTDGISNELVHDNGRFIRFDSYNKIPSHLL